MPKKFFKRFAPNASTIKSNKHFGFLGSALHHPNLWHFNRNNIALAFAIGLFCMWIPFPFQSVLAACIAVFFKANLPLSVALVFITNPITVPPMFYFAYEIGTKLLKQEAMQKDFSFSVEWMAQMIHHIWQPLFLGCLILSILSSALGYYGVKLLWRLHIIQRLKSRKQRDNH